MTARPDEVPAQLDADVHADLDADEIDNDDPTPGPAPTGSSRKAMLITAARRVLLVVVVAGAIWTLVRNWPAVWATLHTMPVGAVVLSELAVILAIGVSTLAWRTLVEDLGPPVGALRCAQINLVGALGKYIPGSVWAYLLQMELGRKAGVGRARIFTASIIQVGIALVATALFAVLALPSLLGEFPGAVVFTVLLPIGLIALHPTILTWATNLVLRVLRRRPLPHRLRLRTIGTALGLQLLSYALFGVHLWILARAVGAAPGGDGLLLCIAAISIGLNAGMFFFILPSGAGIRDGVIIAVLISALPYGQALAFAVVSRAMFLVADLITAGLAAGMARWRVPLRRHGADAVPVAAGAPTRP